MTPGRGIQAQGVKSIHRVHCVFSHQIPALLEALHMVIRSKAVQLKPRLTAPQTLSDCEARVFRSTVQSVDPDHFTSVDLPLLTEFCRASALADQAAVALANDGVVINGRASPWIVVQEKAQRALVALAARLRVCPQSRFDRLGAGSRSRTQVFGIDESDPFSPETPKKSMKPKTGLAAYLSDD